MISNDWNEELLKDVINFNPREKMKRGIIAKKVGMADLAKHTKKIQNYSMKEYKGGSRFRNGDTLLARITPSLENGKTAQVDILEDDEIGFGSTEFIVMREKEGKSLNDFIYYLSISPKFRNMAIKSMTGSSGRQRVQRDVLENTSFKVPSLLEQKIIANFLSSLDKKIELNNKINTTLEQIIETIFNQWFINFQFPNENEEPYKESGGTLISSNTEYGNIPEEWRVTEFKEVIDKVVDNRGKTPPLADIGVRLVEGYQISVDSSFPNFETGEKQKYVSKETYNNWFRSGHPKFLDILCATVGTLPKWCFVPKDKDICIAQNIVAYRVNTDICTPYYLKSFINNPNFIGDFNGRIVTTAQPSIKLGHLESINILLPNIGIIRRFDSIAKPMYEKIHNNLQENIVIRKIRDTLLPKLMSGEIRVPIEE